MKRWPTGLLILAGVLAWLSIPAPVRAANACTHNGGEIIWQWTVTEHQEVWSCCGEPYSLPEDHMYDGQNGHCRLCGYLCTHSSITEASCTAGRHCDYCGMRFSGIDPTKHPDYDLYYRPVDADNHQLTWACCQMPEAPEESHQWHNGVCPLCEAQCQHVWLDSDSDDYTCSRCAIVSTHKTKIVPAVPATCTADGLTQGKVCADCDAVLLAQAVVPAKGHSPVTDPAVPATCTEAGLTQGSHCSVCSAVLTAQVPVPSGHTPVTDPAVPATCTTDGLTQGSHCSACSAVLAAQEPVPAKGHSPVTDPAVPATHVTTGLTEGRHCSACGLVMAAQASIPIVEVQKTALPGSLSRIGDEAFAGSAFVCIILPDGCSAIGAAAFRDCTQLRFVEIPLSVTAIDSTAFDGCSEQLVIVTDPGSEAARFAAVSGIPCVLR